MSLILLCYCVGSSIFFLEEIILSTKCLFWTDLIISFSTIFIPSRSKGVIQCCSMQSLSLRDLVSLILYNQRRSEVTSSVAFEVLIINCQTCFKDFFSFNCLTPNYCFSKRSLTDRREWLLWTRVLVFCSWIQPRKWLPVRQTKFWGTTLCVQIY